MLIWLHSNKSLIVSHLTLRWWWWRARCWWTGSLQENASRNCCHSKIFSAHSCAMSLFAIVTNSSSTSTNCQKQSAQIITNVRFHIIEHKTEYGQSLKDIFLLYTKVVYHKHTWGWLFIRWQGSNRNFPARR